MLERGADMYPDIAAIQNRLGVLLAIHKRQYDRASAFIQRAIELDPQNLHYKSNLGKILSKKRNRNDSEGDTQFRRLHAWQLSYELVPVTSQYLLGWYSAVHVFGMNGDTG